LEAKLHSAFNTYAEDDVEPEWSSLSINLQRLYSKNKATRHIAAKRLVVLVAGGSGLLEDASIEGACLLAFALTAVLHVHACTV
jgi:hypothetical protein